MIPVYAFVEGDLLGLLVFAQESETVAALITRVQATASLRVKAFAAASARHRGRVLDPRRRVSESGVAALDRVDIVRTR
jgi:Tfp pilus assembly protein PilN